MIVEAPGLEDGKGADIKGNSWNLGTKPLLLGPSNSPAGNLATADRAARHQTPEEVLASLDPNNPVHVLAVVGWLRGSK
jgi:hypothetical protein